MKVRFAVSVGLGPPDPEGFESVCRGAERVGFDTIWLSDVPSMAAVEPALGVAYAAAVTERVHLGINLIPFGSTPYLVAHRMAQLDRLAGGRLLITLVPGLDLPGEREALGTAGRHRGRMMDELIPQLRDLWSGDRLPVVPVQDPLEIWTGGSGPESVARAGRLADGWLGSLGSPGRAGEIVRAIQAEATAAGRTVDPEHFGLSIGYARDQAAVEAAAAGRSRVRAVPTELIPIGADGLRRLIDQLVDEGLSKFVVRPLGPLGDWEDELSWLAEVVLPLQT